MSALTRWQRPEASLWAGFGRLRNLHEELDRLFDLPLGELSGASQLLSDWNPALDVYEDKDNLFVKVELPGMKREDIDVSLHEGTLSVSGERKAENKTEKGDVYRSERFFGRFQRSVTLPTAVAADKVKAQYKDGILTVMLPKSEEAKPKQININVS